MTFGGKKLLARKYCNKPEQLNHKFYEVENLLRAWGREGLSESIIKERLIKHITKEREKCVNSVAYFTESYGFVAGDGTNGIIPIKLENYQLELLESCQHDKYIICVKARQLGVSTALVFYALWFSLFSTGKRCLVVAHRKESAEEFVTKCKTAYEFLPEWLKPACLLYSKNTIEFETKSVIKSMTSNPNAARSFSGTLVILDEAAFIEHCDEVVTAINPTIAASDGRMVAISTPNGNSDTNWFYRTCNGAKFKINGWKYFDYPWTVASKYLKNPNFRTDQIRIDNGNVDKFRKEYECCFDVNLTCLFNKDALTSFVPSTEILNKMYGGITYDDTFYTWKLPDPNKKYIIGVDCASNKASAKDSSSFQVIDSDLCEQYAEYVGKLPTEIFVDILLKTARYYNNALLVIEANSYSEMVFYLLEQKGYSNIWYDNNNRPGFNTNRATRPMLIEKLLLFYNNPVYCSRLKSARLKIQMENFSVGSVYSDGSRKAEAVRGHHDDIILALALSIITLTPKEHIHKPNIDYNVIMDAKELLNNGSNYSDEYIEYHSKRMGISKEMLVNRLKIYHNIKNGSYDGSGLESLNIVHPVEEFERQQSAKEFMGISFISDTGLNLDNISLLPSDRQFTRNDIFSDEYISMVGAHQNFLRNRGKF